ncbi:MAG: response regulator transcription factor [Bacteroidales bacterium]|nr:response regulator transcription factor [Bacteroidales bacterium]
MTSNGKILIWCEAAVLRKNIRHFWESKAYETVLCQNFNEVLTALRIDDYRLIVTDCPYPHEELALLLKKYPGQPVACMGRHNEQIDTSALSVNLHLFRQPFDLSELEHCLQPANQEEKKRLFLGKYEILPQSYAIRCKNETLNIPKKEMELLLLLLKNSPGTVSKEEIAAKLWPSDKERHDNSINVYINNLRKYFQSDRRIGIVTVYGKGIRLDYTE